MIPIANRKEKKIRTLGTLIYMIEILRTSRKNIGITWQTWKLQRQQPTRSASRTTVFHNFRRKKALIRVL
jgi:hypothetical protein